MPNNDMGDPKNITEKSIAEAAKASGQSMDDARKNALELLQKVIEAPEIKPDSRWRP
jgi:hypothetical protein